MIQLRLLGGLDLRDDHRGELASLLAQPKRVGLLAYLSIASPRGFHRRDKLLALFWPEADEAHARASLRKAIHVLRRALGDESLPGRGDEEVAVNSQLVTCDVVAFDEAMAAGRLDEALSCYRGDLLDGFFLPDLLEFERWVETQRRGLRQRAAAAARQLSERLEAEGNLAKAVDNSRRALELTPDDVTLRRLMALLDRLGDRAGAIQSYESVAARFAADYGSEPDAETRAMVQSIRTPQGQHLSTAGVEQALARSRRDSTAISTTALAPVARSRRRVGRLAVIGLATAVAVGGAWLVAAAAGTRWWSAGRAPIQSLAVLPLRNLTGDPEQDYLVEGMTYSLGTELGQIGSLRVISGTSPTRYKKTDKSATGIASELGVDALIEGAVMRSADQVRINVQLIDGRTDRRLWTQSYDRALDDILSVYTDVARAVAEQISATVTRHKGDRAVRSRSVKPAAYEAYMRGLYFRKRYQAGGCVQAQGYLHEAITLDSTFAKPYADLAYCYAWDRLGLPPADVERKAHAAINKAFELDGNLAAAHQVLGIVKHRLEYDWAGAERAFRHALALDPSDPDVYIGLGEFQYAAGRADEGLATMRRGLALDPFNLDNNVGLGFALRVVGRHDEAIEQLLKTLELDPNYPSARVALAEAYATKGSRDQAVVEYLAWLRLLMVRGRSEEATAALANAYARAGWNVFWKKMLELCTQETRHPGTVFTRSGPCGPGRMARLYVRLGDRDRALASLEAAYAQRAVAIVFLKREPTFGGLRADPRFQDLVRRAKIP